MSWSASDLGDRPARRRHVGSAATGTVYDMLNEEKRNAVEMIVEDKAAERDEEHADDTVPDSGKPVT